MFNARSDFVRIAASASSAVKATLLIFAVAPTAAWADGATPTFQYKTCQQLEQICEQVGQEQMASGRSGPPWVVAQPSDCQGYMSQAIQAGGKWTSPGIVPTVLGQTPPVFICTVN